MKLNPKRRSLERFQRLLGAKQSAAQLILAKSLQPLWQHPQIYHKKRASIRLSRTESRQVGSVQFDAARQTFS